MAQQGSDRKSGNILEDILLNGQLAWKLMTDPRVTMMSKVLIPLAGFLYFISPIDFLPDFIPVLGQLDEVAILLLLVRLFIAVAPQEVVAEYKAAMGHSSGQPKGKTLCRVQHRRRHKRQEQSGWLTAAHADR